MYEVELCIGQVFLNTHTDQHLYGSILMLNKYLNELINGLFYINFYS